MRKRDKNTAANLGAVITLAVIYVSILVVIKKHTK